MNFFQRKASLTSRVYSLQRRWKSTRSFLRVYSGGPSTYVSPVLTEESQDIKNRFLPATTNLANGSCKAGYRDDFSSSAMERSNDKERWFVRRKADKFAADPIIDSSATAIRFHLASGCPSRTLIQRLYKRRVKRSPAAIDAFFFLSVCLLIFNHSLLQIAISSFEARTNV